MSKKQLYVDDFWAKKAKKEGYRARSYYKLKEIDEKFRLLDKKKRVLDLGAAPGSWTQYVLEKDVSDILAVDLKEIEDFKNSKVICLMGDIFEIDFKPYGLFDVILSDMAPNTTGIKDIDSSRSMELIERVLSFSSNHLNEGGSMVCKFLQGVPIEGYLKQISNQFQDCKIYKPESIRKNSSEFYFIGKNLKKTNN